MALFCGSCGVQAVTGDVFCGGCGNRLDAGPPEPPAPRRRSKLPLILIMALALFGAHYATDPIFLPPMSAAPVPSPLASSTAAPPTPPATPTAPAPPTLAVQLDARVVFGAQSRLLGHGKVAWEIWCKSPPEILSQLASITYETYDSNGRPFERVVSPAERFRHLAGARFTFRRTTRFVDGSSSTDSPTLEAAR